jgi:hypothetical protein
VLGDGRLRRESPAGPIDHPVLLQRVELEFDPERAGVPRDRRGPRARLYGAVLVGEGALSGDKLHAVQRELEQGGFHPLALAGTSDFLRRLTALLGPSATYRDAPDGRADGAPLLVRDPVLFLRLRVGTAGRLRARAGAPAREPAVPASLARSSASRPRRATRTARAARPVGRARGRAAQQARQPEQVEIARALQRHGAVIVQGPPGTGKSHTIANLVGHLVADGQRVLVTSQTTKALRVLREHIVEELRPLCVALLDQDLEGRAQLEAAVRGIAERLTVAQEPQLLREIEALGASRAQLVDVVARLSENLRAARESVPARGRGRGRGGPDPRTRRARWPAARPPRRLPGPLGAGRAALEDELAALYASYAELSPEEDADRSRAARAGAAHAGGLARRSSADRGQTLAGARFWRRAVDPADEPVLGLLSDIHVRLLADAELRALAARAGRRRPRRRQRARAVARCATSRAGVRGAAAARDLLLDHEVEMTDCPRRARPGGDARPAAPRPAARRGRAAGAATGSPRCAPASWTGTRP